MITLLVAGLALFARFGGYRDQLTSSTLRSVASPVYYNLTLFPAANTASEPNGGRKLRTELTSYLRLQAHDTGVTVLLLDADGNVISDQGDIDPSLASEHFDVPPRAGAGPELRRASGVEAQARGRLDPAVRHRADAAAVRLQPAGIAGIVVALPRGDAARRLPRSAPRLLFAGGIALRAAIVVALILWAWMYRPIGRVTRGIRAVARGRLSASACRSRGRPRCARWRAT